MPLSDHPCSSSPTSLRSESAESVVLPVPDKPKNNAVLPSLPTLAEQCIGKTPFFGRIKFMIENIAFLISPAYEVDPIKTIFLLKLIMMKVSVLVPISSGLAAKSSHESKVNSGTRISNSSGVGLVNSCRANRLCQARLLTILIGSLFSGSAPTKPSKIKNSLSSTCFFIILNILSNFSSGIGWLTFPQSMVLCVTSSSTIYLSSGDLPVNFPVLTEREPVDERMPSFLLIMTSTSDGTDRL